MDGIITRDQSSKWQKSLNGDATIGFRRTIGANKTFQQKHGNRVVLGESAEFRRLRHAVEKAHGDRDQAIRSVCRLYGVKAIDALPGAIRAATLALLGPSV
jgi:streptomycin 6-kinase